MRNPTIHYKRPGGRSFFERALAILVLVGYLFVLYGSSVGHGWRLLIHLTADHQATTLAPTAERQILRTLNPDRLPTPHTHGGITHQHTTPADEVGDGHTGVSPNVWNTPHEHDGQFHTHEQQPASDAVLLVILLLDQHCLFTSPAISPLPPARDVDFTYAPAAFLHLSLPVETPPPRFTA